jgi:hypothetical protein
MSINFDVCTVIAKNSNDLRVLKTPAEARPGRKFICQMISTCARKKEGSCNDAVEI